MSTLETEIAWAAGFFDGEGCTTLLRKRGSSSRVVRVAVSQKDRRALDRFHRAVGVGKVYGPAPNRSACWTWQTTNEPDSRTALETLWPYLGEAKREQAETKLASSTWHGGPQIQCVDIKHEFVRRADNGGKRCKTCRDNYNKTRPGRQGRPPARDAILEEVA